MGYCKGAFTSSRAEGASGMAEAVRPRPLTLPRPDWEARRLPVTHGTLLFCRREEENQRVGWQSHASCHFPLVSHHAPTHCARLDLLVQAPTSAVMRSGPTPFSGLLSLVLPIIIARLDLNSSLTPAPNTPSMTSHACFHMVTSGEYNFWIATTQLPKQTEIPALQKHHTEPPHVSISLASLPCVATRQKHNYVPKQTMR